MKSLALVVTAVCILNSGLVACDFRYNPAATPRYYREQGWMLPGIHDGSSHGKAIEYGIPPLSPVLKSFPGAKAILIPRDRDHYVISFPEQVFSLGTDRKRMEPLLAKAVIIRWEINGKIVAYSYSLIPIKKAFKRHGDWVYEGELACIFYGTFIDEKGDGVFRTLVPDTLRPEYIPLWATPPTA
jgi:hypothetical protein